MSRVRHLYVHLPPGAPEAARASAGLRREVELRDASELLVRPLETMGVGGGATAALGPQLMTALRSAVGRAHLEEIREWTVEASPDGIDRALAHAWADAGVTRMNVDVGTYRAEALGWMGRAYDLEAVHDALAAASAFPSWGVDLLYGLPPAVEPDPLESVKAVVDLGAPHISLYEWLGTGGADDDLKADQYLAVGEHLRRAGYEAYEMMAFARPGHASRHSVAVLRGADFLGLGPGAHSRVDSRRSWNLSDWQVYLTTVESGRLPDDGEERPDTEAVRLEELWAGLRLHEGVPRQRLGPTSRVLVDRWIRAGLAHAGAEGVRLTPEGWLRLDELAVELARTEALVEPLPGRGRLEE